MKRTLENETCPGCGAEVIYARAVNANEQLVPIDIDRREGGRIVLVHKVMGEPPWIHWLNDEELEESRAKHQRRADLNLEEPGPFCLFDFHDCRNTTGVAVDAAVAT